VIVMSQIWLPDGAENPGRPKERFPDLLLADDDLLRAEFDTIIAAGWPGPPPLTCPTAASTVARPPAGSTHNQRHRPECLDPAGVHT